MDTMTTTTSLKPITQSEYLQAELGYLLRRLAEGDKENAATSLATLQQELYLLRFGVDPGNKAMSRITTENGRYYRWPFLDE